MLSKRHLISILASVSLLGAYGCSDDDTDKPGGGGAKVCKAPVTNTNACKVKADCKTPFKDCVNSKCVLCSKDTDCPLGPKQCNKSFGICKFCTKDAECTVAGKKLLTGKCDTGLGQCLKCDADADCNFTGATATKCASSKCVQCKADADCTKGAGNTGKCASGWCVGCAAQADCDAAWAGKNWKCE